MTVSIKLYWLFKKPFNLILSSETVLGVAKVLKPRCSLMGKNLIINTKAAVEDGLELERLTN